MPGIAAVLLAAGESSRMGQPKPLLPWGGRPLLRCQVDALLEAGAAPVIVVLGPTTLEAESLLTGLEGVQAVVNHRAPEGKTTSVRLGVEHVPGDAGGLLLLAVDQPRTAGILRAVIDRHAISGALITHPAYRGRGGHPIIFDASLVPELLAVTEERQGIREVVSRHREALQRVEMDDPMVRLDLNTMDDYRAALASYAPGS